MPEDFKPQRPQPQGNPQAGPPQPPQSSQPLTPRPQPQIKSMDGFTNSPKPSGSPQSFTSENNGNPATSSNPNTPFSSGGVAKPTVIGMPQNTQFAPQSYTTPPQNTTPVIKGKSHKKLWLLVIILLVLLALGAGYVFAFYLPNTPKNVYKSSIDNTGLAVDKLIQYSRTQQQQKYKTISFDGSLNVKSSEASFDSTLSGDLSEKNGQVKFSSDLMSQQVKAELRYVTASSNKAPDVYLQASGVKSLLDSAGMKQLTKYDGKWIVIDHTLIETYSKALQQELQQMSQMSMSDKTKAPTDAQVNDAVDKIQAVNKQYIFTSDPSKAVLANEKYLGKETVNGRVQYHYNVGYNRDHLAAYVNALGQAVNTSQLNDWYKKQNDGKNMFSDSDLKDAQDQIKKADANYTFEMWADKDTKLVSKLAFADQKNKSNVFTISQGYTGGAEYPFSVGFTGKDDSGNPQSFSLGLTVNSQTNKVNVTLKADSKDSSGSTSVDGHLTITPSNDKVTVTAPTGATPIMTILNSLGLGGAANSLLGGPNIPACKVGDTKCKQPVTTPSCSNPSLYLACLPSASGSGSGTGNVNPGGVICRTPAAACLDSNTN